MTDKIKDKLSDYMSPTPANMRLLGDGLLAASLFITATAALNEMKGLTITAAAIGIIGKFLTNFFKKK
ncbi:MAG: hypothetical protein COA88_12815 [Kordia sp.]|jgi:hypothetical protein|nr:MAG: hypothetical protein COA88_12815 [Kordia sp.]